MIVCFSSWIGMQVLTTAPSPHRYVTMIVCFSLLLCQVR